VHSSSSGNNNNNNNDNDLANISALQRASPVERARLSMVEWKNYLANPIVAVMTSMADRSDSQRGSMISSSWSASSSGSEVMNSMQRCVRRSRPRITDRDGWCAGLAARCFYWSRLRSDGCKALQRSEECGGPEPQFLEDGTPIPAKYWGISRAQISNLFEQAKKDPAWDDNDTAYDFVSKFVKPLTAGTGRGLALNMNKALPLEVNLMISHAWCENIGDFFSDVLQHMAKHEVAYICFLANYQGTREEIKRQLGNDINTSPFTQVIRNPHCLRLLVVPNDALRGKGLYSRLWCDLEIKVAADEGLPIHIPTRNSDDYLLGNPRVSSMNARCGSRTDRPPNEDELLIRKGIEEMPPKTARSLTFEVCIVTMCAAFAPGLFVQCCMRSVFGWTLGLALGIFVGMGASFAVSRLCRPNLRNGYQVLDSVIDGAAKGWYHHRRVRPAQDIFSYLLFGGSLAVVDFLVRWNRDGFDCATIGIVEGLSAGVCLWPIARINHFGPWTGVYIMRPKTRRLVGLFLAACAGVSALFSYHYWNVIFGTHRTSTQAIGRGMTVGWLFGLLCLSAFCRKLWHSVNLAFMFTVALYDSGSERGAFHEIFLLLLGFGAVQNRGEWEVGTRLLLCCMQVGSISLLFYVGGKNPQNLLPMLQKSQCEVEDAYVFG